MKKMQQLLIISLVLFFVESAIAAVGPSSKLIFEPLYGVETALVQHPEPSRYVTRAVYGGRMLYGTTFLSAEAEYTEANSRERYSGIDQDIEDRVQRGSLGLRTTLPMNRFVALYFRAGGRASQGETKITTAGVSETREMVLRIDPYGGAGLQLGLSRYFALNAGATLFGNSESKYDVQYTLGLSLRFGNM